MVLLMGQSGCAVVTGRSAVSTLVRRVLTANHLRPRPATSPGPRLARADGVGKALPVGRHVTGMFAAAEMDVDQLVAAKAGRRTSVCLPAKDESGTVGAIVAA